MLMLFFVFLLLLNFYTMNEIREDVQDYENGLWLCFGILIAGAIIFAYGEYTKLACLSYGLSLLMLIIQKFIRILDLCFYPQDFNVFQCLLRVTINITILVFAFYLLHSLVCVYGFGYECYSEIKSNFINFTKRLKIF